MPTKHPKKPFYSTDQIKKIFLETQDTLPRPTTPSSLHSKYRFFSDTPAAIPGLEPLAKFDQGDFCFHTFANRVADTAEPLPLKKWFYSYRAGEKEYGPYDRNSMVNLYDRNMFDSSVLIRDSRNFYFTSLKDMIERRWKSFFVFFD